MSVYFFPSSLKAGITFAPFVATPKKIIRKALALAGLKPGETLCDLGSGTGKALTIGEKEFGANGIGFELATPFYFISKINLFLCRSKKIKIFRENFLKANLQNADVIFLFLTPKAFRLMENKLKAETKSGARVVTFASPLLFWQPSQTAVVPGIKEKIYLYKVS